MGKCSFFLRKPSHVTPQIDHLRKMSPVLRVSTHIYGVSKEIHGETFIFWVNWGMWPLKLMVLEKWALFWEFSKEIDGKTLIFQVNLGMWPSNRSSHKNKLCSDGFNTHFWQFSLDRWENIHFLSKPRHVTPQIDYLGKLSPVLQIPTPIYAVAKQIGGKTCIFKLNLVMWPLKLIVLGKRALFWGFQHTFMGFISR